MSKASKTFFPYQESENGATCKSDCFDKKFLHIRMCFRHISKQEVMREFEKLNQRLIKEDKKRCKELKCEETLRHEKYI